MKTKEELIEQMVKDAGYGDVYYERCFIEGIIQALYNDELLKAAGWVKDYNQPVNNGGIVRLNNK